MLSNLNIVEETSSPQLLTDGEIQSLTELGIDLSPILSSSETSTEINDFNNAIIFEEVEIDTEIELNCYIPDIYKNTIVTLTDRFKNLKWILNSLELLYPQKYDYNITHIDASDIAILQIYIYYPSIEISNGTETHTINKLLVNIELQLDGDEIIFNSIEGTRLELTGEEALAGYLHSHLMIHQFNNNTIRDSYFTNFCIGGGMYGRYSTGKSIVTAADTDIDAHILSFFTAVDNTLAWESLEGGPYIGIRQIKARSTAKTIIDEREHAFSTINDVLTADMSAFIKFLLAKLDIDALTEHAKPTSIVIKNYYSLIHDEELIKFAELHHPQLLVIYKDLQYYFSGDLPATIAYNERYVIENLTFRDKKVTRTIVPTSKESTITYCINPVRLRKLIEYLIFKFCNYLYYRHH